MPTLSFYTEAISSTYKEKGTDGFLYCQQLGYLFGYNRLYLEREVEDFVSKFETVAHSTDPLYVGKFCTRVHDLFELHADITRFDQELDTKFSTGYRLSALADRCGRDSQALGKLQQELGKVNTQAAHFISGSIARLSALVQDCENMLQERMDGKSDIIQNWDDLDRAMNGILDTLLQSICVHIREFLKLMHDVFK